MMGWGEKKKGFRAACGGNDGGPISVHYRKMNKNENGKETE